MVQAQRGIMSFFAFSQRGKSPKQKIKGEIRLLHPLSFNEAADSPRIPGLISLITQFNELISEKKFHSGEKPVDEMYTDKYDALLEFHTNMQRILKNYENYEDKKALKHAYIAEAVRLCVQIRQSPSGSRKISLGPLKAFGSKIANIFTEILEKNCGVIIPDKIDEKDDADKIMKKIKIQIRDIKKTEQAGFCKNAEEKDSLIRAIRRRVNNSAFSLPESSPVSLSGPHP